MRLKGGFALALLALLVGAPAAGASQLSIRSSDGVVVYAGDAAADTVSLTRFVDEDNDAYYYIVSDSGGISPQAPCGRVNRSSTTAFCPVQSELSRYELRTGDGDDVVTVPGLTGAGTVDLGNGNDRFTGREAGTAAEAVDGSDGNDILRGGGGNDVLMGGAGADQLGGEGQNDRLDGGAGDDALEFGGASLPEGVGAGADDLRGGSGRDRLSYNDGPAVRVTLDEQANDGAAGERDNVRGDVETIVGSTAADVIVGNGAAQDLFGHGGNDRIDGLAGSDDLNGGTGDDQIYGGAGDDRLEGSADEDYLEGGSGIDLFEGDNVCTATPCTGASDFIQARDGQADTVNCGVGADTALVDAIDVVAQDSQHGCERIDRALPRATTVVPPAGVLGTTQGGPIQVRVIGKRRLRTLRRGRLRVEVTCPASCRVRARLIAGRTVVASRTRTRLGQGEQVLRLRMSKRGRRLLKRRTRVGTTLVVDVVDDQNRTTTLTRVLRFRR